MTPTTTKGPPRSFRLTADALRLLAALAARAGISQAAVLETLIRDRAKKGGVK